MIPCSCACPTPAAACLRMASARVGESRAPVAHRHFDLPGATSITTGLMVLVYAITRASAHGWSDGLTVALLAASAVMIGTFVAIEARSPAPLLPLRIFRLRTLSAANAITLANGATVTAMFFLLTLYMQQVLRYSAVETGAAFVAIGLTAVFASNTAQRLTTRFGARLVLIAGTLTTAGAVAFFAQLPADGHYVWNVLPGLLLGGVGLALCFIPLTIASLTGVQPADAGVASGLLNTNRQIGGALGLAAVTTIAASATTTFAHSQPASIANVVALTHGFQVAFYVLMALSLAGTAIAILFVEPAAKPASVERIERSEVSLEEAA